MICFKECTICRETKDLANFRLRKDTGKYRNSCLDCDSAYFAKNRIKNRAKINVRSKLWYRSNKDIAKERVKNWRKNNPEMLLKNRKVSVCNAKERYKNDKEFRERRKDSVKLWKKNNPSKIAEYRKRDFSKLSTRISSNLRSRLRAAVKGGYKTGSAVSDLGCSVQDFKTYLESLWQPGMTWDNYGLYGWHIDHIKPLSSFDLSKREQIVLACHYANLQPLWAKDNIRKGSKKS